MPRSASRLTLVVAGVRAEPLRAISADDAEAEGLRRGKARRHLFWRHAAECRLFERRSHKAVFAEIWEGLHGRGAWEKDPPVAVIEFKAEHRYVDEMSEAKCGGER